MATNCYPSTADWRCLPDGTTLDPELKETAEMLAWSALRVLTGFQTGNCPVTVRPCAAACGGLGTWFTAIVPGEGLAGVANMGGTFHPNIVDGMWINACGCGPGDTCSCQRLSKIVLPGPIGEVVEIKVDGAVVDPSAYLVIGDAIVRTDGTPWPRCQDFSAGEDEVGSFVVTYRQGYPIDELVNIAADRLAMEFFYACTNDGRCQLPANTQLVVRQGVTLELNGSIFNSEKTGLAEVDVVIAMLNPFGLKVGPQVWSPDRRVVR